MLSTSRMFKTIVIGAAGLYAVKVIADSEPPKAYVAQPNERGINENGNNIYIETNNINNGQKPLEHNIDDLKKKVQSFGSEASRNAMSIYDDAYKSFQQAKENLDSSKGKKGLFWASSGDKQLQEKYDEAKKHMNSLKDSLNDYVTGSDSSYWDGITGSIKDTYGKAQDYIGDKYNQLGGNAEDTLRENLVYYKKQVEDSRKEWDQTKSSWLHWRNAQSQEIQDRAQAKYNFFKAKNDNAIDQLADYLSQTGKQAKDIINELGDEAGKHLNKINDKAANVGHDISKKGAQVKDQAYRHGAKDRVVQAGYDANDKINENAEYAKHYAAGVKDSAVQAGYNAKENIEDNAEYAKHYAAGVKDSAVQAGYDAKDQINQNARYAKDKVGEHANYVKGYAEDAKDNVVQAGYNAKDAAEDNAEYLKHQAAVAKDKVVQAGYDAKDKIYDNAQYAHDVAGDVKDRVVQAGADTKDKIQDDAHYLKDYVVGAKDDAVKAGKQANENIKDNAQYAKNKLNDGAEEIGDHANNYIEGAKDWISRASANTKNFIVNNYNHMWNSLGIFSAHSQEVAEQAVQYYDDEVRKAKKEYDATQASWLRWTKAQSEEAQEQAKNKWEILKAKRDAANDELQRWINKKN